MAEQHVNASYLPVRTGKVLVPPSPDPTTAFRREVTALLAEGHEKEAFGLCVGLAMLTCQPVEVLWETFTLI
jgi:hypothetical protein